MNGSLEELMYFLDCKFFGTAVPMHLFVQCISQWYLYLVRPCSTSLGCEVATHTTRELKHDFAFGFIPESNQSLQHIFHCIDTSRKIQVTYKPGNTFQIKAFKYGYLVLQLLICLSRVLQRSQSFDLFFVNGILLFGHLLHSL